MSIVFAIQIIPQVFASIVLYYSIKESFPYPIYANMQKSEGQYYWQLLN